MRKITVISLVLVLFCLVQFAAADADPSKRVKIADNFNDSSFNTSMWQSGGTNPDEGTTNATITVSANDFWSLENFTLGDNVSIDVRLFGHDAGSTNIGFGFYRNDSVVTSDPGGPNNALCGIQSLSTTQAAIHVRGTDNRTLFDTTKYDTNAYFRLLLNETGGQCEVYMRNTTSDPWDQLATKKYFTGDLTPQKYLFGLTTAVGNAIGIGELRVFNLSLPEESEGPSTESNIWNLSGKNVFVTNTSRDVAIGAKVPSQRLHVNGSANVTGTMHVGRISINHPNPDHDLRIGDGTYSELDAGEAQFTTSSSREYKENIVPVRMKVLEKIAKIPVNTYDFKPEYCGVLQSCTDRLGLIAEDFHAIFGRGSEKELSGQEVQMALWLAVQELHEEVSALKEQNELLKEALCSLKPKTDVC